MKRLTVGARRRERPAAEITRARFVCGIARIPAVAGDRRRRVEVVDVDELQIARRRGFGVRRAFIPTYATFVEQLQLEDVAQPGRVREDANCQRTVRKVVRGEHERSAAISGKLQLSGGQLDVVAPGRWLRLGRLVP